jgi:hypothetical protein
MGGFRSNLAILVNVCEPECATECAVGASLARARTESGNHAITIASASERLHVGRASGIVTRPFARIILHGFSRGDPARTVRPKDFTPGGRRVGSAGTE